MATNRIIQSPKVPPITCQQPYVILATPDFGGIVEQRVTAYTQSTGFPMRILAATTNLTSVQVQIRGVSDELWNEEPANVLAVAGRNNLVNIYKRLYAPYLMQGRDVLRLDFIDTLGTAQGAVYFWCERVVEEPPTFELPYPRPFTLSVSPTPTNTTLRTRTVNERFIVQGATYTNSLAGASVRISDSFTNQQWSDDALPIEVFGGNQNNTQPILFYERPFALEPNTNIKVEFSDVLAAGQFSFVGIIA